MKSSCHRLIPFLPFLLNHLRLPSPELDKIPFLPDYSTSTTPVLPIISYNHFARTQRKTPSSIFKNACVLVRNLEMDVIFSRARVLPECVYRFVA
jgi:hypothetical protein